MMKNIIGDAANKFAGVINNVDPHFPLLTTFQFTVPKDYIHETQLASFAKENRKKFYSYNNNIIDENFAKATNKLTPGKIYEAQIFGINKTVFSIECLTFLKTQSAILVGVQGLSVVWQQAKEQFPKGKWVVAFDEKNALWQDAGGVRRVPRVARGLDGAWFFGLGSFEYVWDYVYCLFCSRDLSA